MTPIYRRFPNWQIDLFPVFRPIRLTPAVFKDEESIDGWKIKTWGITWLFFTLTLDCHKRLHDGKAGFQ